MSPNGTSSGLHKIIIISSSDSSDSESFLQEDVKSSGSQINSQWEAIERTLYQEPGQQVTDSELLKECKLWRETFPHFRVKGTKINIQQTDQANEIEKNLQTLNNHLNFEKLQEKRENIKTKVVGMLVERLIAKYGPEKECAKSGGSLNNGMQITEINDGYSENINKSANKYLEAPTVASTDSESYFERGKPNGDLSELGEEDDLREILESWEKDSKTAKKLPKSYRKGDFKTLETQKQNFVAKLAEEQMKERFKPKKSSSSSKTLVKPFEMTKKIDKKYEGLVDKIFERRTNELETIRHCRTSASGLDIKNFEESLDKLRIGSAFDDYMKKTAKFRMNKFNNNWLKRSEANFSYTEDSFVSKKTSKEQTKSSKLNLRSEETQEEIDDRFIEDLRKEVALKYKRPPRRSGVIEEISLRRPKPFKSPVEKAPKSVSCGDLQKKQKPKVRPSKTGLENAKNETNYKKPITHMNNNSKGRRSNTNQNALLPPIETGIICTELTGRPKIGAKIPPKRY